MVSRRSAQSVEKANPAWIPRPNSPLEKTHHKARVEGEAEILPALGAAVAVSAERAGTASLDGPHDFVQRPGFAARENLPACAFEK
jgi:hypothetical protein